MPTIEVSDETYAKIKDQLTTEEAVDITEMDDLIGKKVLIRTVTNYWTGRVKRRIGSSLVLDDAAWIADTGRFADAVKAGTLNEVEPVGNGVMVNLNAYVDIVPWRHKLPTEQK